jgi:uncharacterized membrane protein YhaH (DUF805 family)
MSFWQWFFSFRGRIGRGRWWISILLCLAVSALGASASESLLLKFNPSNASGLSGVLGITIFLLFSAAPTVKRSHDRGRSGWRYLLTIVILVVFAVAGVRLFAVPYIGLLAGWGVILWIVVDLGVLAGDEGPNRFGSDPRTTEEGPMTAAQYLFSFQGRIGRGRWWFGFVLLDVYIFVAGLIVTPLLQLVEVWDSSFRPRDIDPFTIVLCLAAISFFYSFLAIGVKRCHDRGRSGWFLLVWPIPYINIWALVELGFLRGVKGPNRFGPDPRASVLTILERDP